jgi:hypothetical protein
MPDVSIYTNLCNQPKTGERTKMSVSGRRTRVWAVDLGKRMEADMRVRRNILAPAILTVGTVGSLVAGPVLALTTSAAPATAAVAISASPNMVIMHG